MKIIPFIPYSDYTYDRKELEKLTYELYAVLPPTVSYLVIDENDNAVLINAGAPDGEVLQALRENHAELSHILITNGHFEHVYFLKALAEQTNAEIVIHESEPANLDTYQRDVREILKLKGTAPYTGAFCLVCDGDIISAGNLSFKVIHTPGVTPGSVVYQIDHTLFTGDFLAHQAVGICSLPKSDSGALLRSLYKILELKDDYEILPSHWGRTTLQHERETNLSNLPYARIIQTVEV